MMDYRTQNRLGKGMELFGAVGVALIVGYDLPFELSLAPVLSYVYGSGLRDIAIHRARCDGINSTEERVIRSDLTSRVQDGDLGVPFRA
jgi:hypothetical protein